MDFWEIFTLVTGVIYLLLEIRQSNWMWVLGILTGIAAVVVFFQRDLYASMGLNVYYAAISVWGLLAWIRDSGRLPEEYSESIHLNHITAKTVIVSAAVSVSGTIALTAVLKMTGDPMSTLDAAVTVLSAVATWWLGRSFLEQWWLWIVADALSSVLCASQGLWWMTSLYAFYAVSAIYGYIHWRRNGVYLQ